MDKTLRILLTVMLIVAAAMINNMIQQSYKPFMHDIRLYYALQTTAICFLLGLSGYINGAIFHSDVSLFLRWSVFILFCVLFLATISFPYLGQILILDSLWTEPYLRMESLLVSMRLAVCVLSFYSLLLIRAGKK